MGKVKISKDTIDFKFNRCDENEIINKYRISLTERIVRNIAHEIRNPLTNVMLGIEQLKNECPPENETTEAYYGIIKRNCDRINDLISSLVNAAKPVELTTSPQSVNALLEDVIQISQDKLNNKQIALKKSFAEELPKVNVDPEKIKDVFSNILDNALRAMNGMKGELELGTKQNDGKLSISIKDNGIGIMPEDINRVFDPFFRVKSHGAGLGLTLAQNIITNHNGDIKVTSNPNDGTVFTIELNI